MLLGIYQRKRIERVHKTYRGDRHKGYNNEDSDRSVA
jgi:hypothetical protein